MKVTIDTQADTFDDIKKLLGILTEIIQKRESGAVSFNGSNDVDAAPLMSMFSDDHSLQKKEIPDTPPDFSNFLNLTKKQGEKEDRPKIEFF